VKICGCSQIKDAAAVGEKDAKVFLLHNKGAFPQSAHLFLSFFSICLRSFDTMDPTNENPEFFLHHVHVPTELGSNLLRE
jgi:hypothetical protein